MTRPELEAYSAELKRHMEALSSLGEVLPPTVQRDLSGLMSIALHLLAEADRRVPLPQREERQGQ